MTEGILAGCRLIEGSAFVAGPLPTPARSRKRSLICYWEPVG